MGVGKGFGLGSGYKGRQMKTVKQMDSTTRPSELVSGFARTGNELASIDSNLIAICEQLERIAKSLQKLEEKGIQTWVVDGGI